MCRLYILLGGFDLIHLDTRYWLLDIGDCVHAKSPVSTTQSLSPGGHHGSQNTDSRGNPA
jgi:hypothetical protein